MKRPSLKRGLIAVGALSAIAGAFAVGRAVAAGIPSSQPLVYSGTLLDATGAPLADGDYEIGIQLSSTADGSDPVCTQPAATTALNAGRFSVSLLDACTDAIRTNDSTFVQVTVDNQQLGWSKIGAVPYAVEAHHAVNATNATNAIGPLDSRITSLETRLGPPSGFRARGTTAQSIPSGMGTRVEVVEDYDLGDEFASDTSTENTFKANAAGRYLFTCGVMYNVPGVEVGWEVFLLVNGGAVVSENYLHSDGTSVTRHLSAIVPLSATDTVECLTAHNSGAARPLVPNNTYFAGNRLP